MLVVYFSPHPSTTHRQKSHCLFLLNILQTLNLKICLSFGKERFNLKLILKMVQCCHGMILLFPIIQTFISYSQIFLLIWAAGSPYNGKIDFALPWHPCVLHKKLIFISVWMAIFFICNITSNFFKKWSEKHSLLQFCQKCYVPLYDLCSNNSARGTCSSRLLTLKAFFTDWLWTKAFVFAVTSAPG